MLTTREPEDGDTLTTAVIRLGAGKKDSTFTMEEGKLDLGDNPSPCLSLAAPDDLKMIDEDETSNIAIW